MQPHPKDLHQDGKQRYFFPRTRGHRLYLSIGHRTILNLGRNRALVDIVRFLKAWDSGAGPYISISIIQSFNTSSSYMQLF